MSRPRDRATGEPVKAAASTSSSHPSTPGQTQRVPKDRFPAPSRTEEPSGPEPINLNILSTGASRGNNGI